MSTMVVRDVTTADAFQNTGKKADHTVQSTITPFRKVLDQEKAKTVSSADSAASSAQTQKASAVKSQKSSSAAKASDRDTLSGQTTLKDIFKRASEKYNISYDFLTAVAKAESDFNTKCVSSAGAKGIMQIMPAECKELGVKDPFDAEQNIMAAAKLLKAHLKKFNGDYTLAAAAYNAGSGRVQKYGGVPPFTETQNYVKKINQYMKEGVTVPDKKVTVSDTDEYSGSGGSTGAGETKKTGTSFDQGKTASDSDWEQVTVAVGTGDGAVTMTYGAYLRYLELGTTGVG